MKTKVPYYYKDFKCIASECPDTCCAGWEIIIDEDTHEKYKNVSGEFGEILRSKITIYEDGEPGFILEGDDCPFLNKNKLCDIYSELGEDSLCNTCKQFPRFIEEYGDTREIGISISCPEAARIILDNDKKVEFEIDEDDGMVSVYDDVNYDLFVQLMPSRKIALDIMQDRSITLDNRIALLINFAQDIQDRIDANNVSNVEEVRKKYLNKEFIESFIKKLDKYKEKEREKYDNMHKYFQVYKSLEHIDESWPKIVDHAFEYFYKLHNDYEFYSDNHKKFDEYYKDKEYEYEHLIVYFIFRYFMKAVYDYDVLAKVKLAVVSYLIIKELDVVRYIDNKGKLTKEDQIDLMHMYSKDIEHSEDNLEELAQIFEINKVFRLEEILIMIMN
ncbi:MAG: flagellar protein FliB [Clostridium butyricum]|nr:flagellar protein FliB [Clostridium butyricum]